MSEVGRPMTLTSAAGDVVGGSKGAWLPELPGLIYTPSTLNVNALTIVRKLIIL